MIFALVCNPKNKIMLRSVFVGIYILANVSCAFLSASCSYSQAEVSAQPQQPSMPEALEADVSYMSEDKDEQDVVKDLKDLSPIKEKAEEAYSFVKKNTMNDKFCILIDMSYDIYTRRLFVWNFETNSVMEKSVTVHGFGGGSDEENVVFSNTPNTYCSSEGKYRIGARSPSKFGIHIHYKLHGLEPTNSNAYKRTIVVHSYEQLFCDYPMFGSSAGCVVVCDDMMRYLDGLLKDESKPVLLWIFKSK